MFNQIPKDILFELAKQICLPDVKQFAMTCKMISVYLRVWMYDWYPHLSYLISNDQRWLSGFRLLTTLIPMQVVSGGFYSPWVTWQRFRRNLDLTPNCETCVDQFGLLLRMYDNYPDEDHVTLTFPRDLEPSLNRVLKDFFKESSKRDKHYRTGNLLIDVDLDLFNKRFPSFLEALMLDNHRLGFETCIFCIFNSGIRGMTGSGFSPTTGISSELTIRHFSHLSEYVSKIMLVPNSTNNPEYCVKICLSVKALEDFLRLDPHFYTSGNEKDLKIFNRFKLSHEWPKMTTFDLLDLCQKV